MKIALIGYGKMGKEIEKIACSRGHSIVCIIDRENQADLHSEAFQSADVAIEFTSPMAAYANCMACFNANVKVVSGSTGWLEQHLAEMTDFCTNKGKTLFWSSNFSLGVSIFSALNKHLAHIMNNFPTYEVSMTETHHTHKLDAPSGTAITLAEQVIQELDRKESWSKETALTPTQLPIHSIRQGEVPGIHTIQYDSPADSITITHDAKNRSGFALGAVLAAEYSNSHQGLLGMNDLFQF